MPDEATQVEGQRKAIREHIEKYKRFKAANDDGAARTATSTIENAQSHIEKLRRRKPSIASDPLDSWRP
ncbi:hypothetical protein FBY35_0177 [Streptomyces sp. SLBN-118]|nr:hypothetical protein FBY35_0177 [Streptomyces sp. SLBN-118]